MRAITLLREHPLATDAAGKLKSRIATLFTTTQTLVTTPGVHATQRLFYLRELQDRRLERGEEPLTGQQEADEIANSVDLVVEGRRILIRPNPDEMELAFRADEQLQGLVPKRQIQFLHCSRPRVREAIKHRGELWRICPPARSVMEMKKLIHDSKLGIQCGDIYRYNRLTGTRYLTFQSFSNLELLPPEKLRAQLKEIAEYSAEHNRMGHPEIRFFMADERLSPAGFKLADIDSMSDDTLIASFRELRDEFRAAVQAPFLQDDALCADWRNRMAAALTDHGDAIEQEESQLGLSPEFFMQIKWLPGARIEEGELIFDAALDISENASEDHDRSTEEAEKCRGFICNFVREYGDIEHVNVGRVIGSLSSRGATQGRRDVFVVELKLPDQVASVVKLIRMQKWGVREHLDAGMDLLGAMLQSEDYTAYTLDRRIGCRQLGMNLPMRVTSRRLSEYYHTGKSGVEPTLIWSPYFEREFVYGTATDKVPPSKFANEEFALLFARILGDAAAPNLILGRATLQLEVIFDDGDEIVIQNERGLPSEIVVADHTGTFADYKRDLRQVAPAYAKPINRRIDQVRDRTEFRKAYVEAFRERFATIQKRYFAKKRAFDALFRHGHRDEKGNFLYRWDQTLDRLALANPDELAGLIQASFNSTS